MGRLVVALGVWLLVSQFGCRLPWPACQKDQECLATDGRNPTKTTYFCIQGRCQECRTAKDCRDPAKPKCKGHRCAPKTCEDIVCPARKRCRPRDLSCQWICDKDGTSPCDGDRCKFCRGHQCLYKEPRCSHPADCPGMLVCQDPGTCKARCAKGCDPIKCQPPYECYHQVCMRLCEFSPLLFAKGKAEVKKTYASYLDRVKACLDKRPDRVLRLAGHNDEWKFWEYNIHLSLRRAQAVKAAMLKRGVGQARLCVVGYGMEEPVKPTPKSKQSFPENRRVTFKLMNQCP